MNNLLPRSVPMHLKYDMKGSTYKRRASPKERDKSVPTYKDLDFIQDMPEGIQLEPDNYTALCKTIQRDCLVSMHAWGCVLLHANLNAESRIIIMMRILISAVQFICIFMIYSAIQSLGGQ